MSPSAPGHIFGPTTSLTSEQRPPGDHWMDATEHDSRELEVRLGELHSASFAWACSCCGWNEADAEDVLQESYVKVISGRAVYSGRSTFRTWLFGIIRLTALEHARGRKSHDTRKERFAAEVAVDRPNVEADFGGIEADERSLRLRSALEELPARQKEVLHLVFYEDVTIREAADIMEVSIGSARVHYDRGKKRLRTLLETMETGGGAL